MEPGCDPIITPSDFEQDAERRRLMRETGAKLKAMCDEKGYKYLAKATKHDRCK